MPMAHASGLPSAPVISFNATSKIFETAILGFEPPSDGGSIITGYQFATDSQTSGVLGNWQEITKYRNLTNTVGKQIVLVYLQMPSPRNYINISIRAVNSNGPGEKSEKICNFGRQSFLETTGPIVYSMAVSEILKHNKI